MIQVYVLVSFWDENGLHKAGSFTEVKEENFDPYYMQKVDSGSVDAYTKAETDTLLDAKQDDLTAGQNIQINNDVISATDTGDTVKVIPMVTAGTQIANIKVNNSNNYVYAPDAEGGAFVIDCYGIVSNFIDTQTYPSSIGFSMPVLLSELESALSNCSPVFFKFQDGFIVPDAIYKDSDDSEIRGTFTVGRDTVTSGTTHVSDLKIITFQLTGDGERAFAMYVDDATPSGGGGGGGSSATVYQMYDGYGQRISFSALGNASLKLSANSGSTYVGLSAITTAFDAGKVVIKDSNGKAVEITIIDTQQNRFYAIVNNGSDVNMWRFDVYMPDSFEATKVQWT